MKKFFYMVAVVATTALMSGCGLGTAGTSSSSLGSTLLGTAASSLLGGTSTSTSTGSSLASTGLSLLSSLLGGGSVNTNSIVGTWTYNQPQVTFESNNILAKIGGEVAGNKVESALSTQLEKIGLKPGVSTFTFDNNGNVTVKVGSRTTTGTYTLGSDGKLTMKGALGIASLTSTVTINNNQLYMLFDASTLFSALTKLGSSSSTISSLLGSYSGMKLGWSMTR